MIVAKIDIDALKILEIIKNKWCWKLEKIKNSQPRLKIYWFEKKVYFDLLTFETKRYCWNIS